MYMHIYISSEYKFQQSFQTIFYEVLKSITIHYVDIFPCFRCRVCFKVILCVAALLSM